MVKISKSRNEIKIVTLNEPNIKDFAMARNRILKNLKNDWVFFLDSDEIISTELYKEISELDLEGYSGFFVKRKNYFLGKFIGSDELIRLARKDSGYWKRKVHEVWVVKGRLGKLKNPIIHETAKSLKEYISKLNFYSTLHAEANKKEGKRSGFLKIVFYPKIKFIESIINGRGLVFSILQAFHSFLAWSKQWLSQKK